jgi:hypothetical protein
LTIPKARTQAVMRSRSPSSRARLPSIERAVSLAAWSPPGDPVVAEPPRPRWSSEAANGNGRFAVRTGELTPNASVMLVAGVA